MPLEPLQGHSTGTQPALNRHPRGRRQTNQVKANKSPSTPLVFIIEECYLCLIFHALSGMDHFFKNLKFIAISAKSQNG